MWNAGCVGLARSRKCHPGIAELARHAVRPISWANKGADPVVVVQHKGYFHGVWSLERAAVHGSLPSEIPHVDWSAPLRGFSLRERDRASNGRSADHRNIEVGPRVIPLGSAKR